MRVGLNRGWVCRVAVGGLVAGLTMFAVWVIETVPGQRGAVANVPSSPGSFLIPMAVAGVVGLRLRGAGLLGAMAGATAGFALAVAVAAPVYHPHPWDELDGARHAWFVGHGTASVVASWLTGIACWALAGLAGSLLSRRQRVAA